MLWGAILTSAIALNPIRSLDEVARQAAVSAVQKFRSKQVKPDEIGLSIVRLNPANRTYESGHYRGDEGMYPASVVKLFYLAYSARLLEDGKLKLTPEYDRALTDMIVDSNNDATGQVLDIITDTTGGPELSPEDLKEWMYKRGVVNRWLATLGISGINASNKTWNEGPYGRERQGYGKDYEFRNMLTPNSCTKLMTQIALHQLVSSERSEWCQKYLNRVVPADGGKNGQAVGYIGKILPKGSRLFSKAGWVTSEKHDVAHVVLPNGHEYVVAVFTKKHGADRDLLQFLARSMLQQVEPEVTFN